MGWQYSSAGLSAGSQAAPLVGPDGGSTSSASNIGNQRDATGPRCRVGRSQVHRGILEIDGRPNLGPFCREPKIAPGQVCPVAGRRSAVATPRSRLPVLPAVETDRRQPQKSFCRETTSRRGSSDSTSQANRMEFTTGTSLNSKTKQAFWCKCAGIGKGMRNNNQRRKKIAAGQQQEFT